MIKAERVTANQRPKVLQQVLGAVGIQAGYYPPPSEEELASMGSPHTLGV